MQSLVSKYASKHFWHFNRRPVRYGKATVIILLLVMLAAGVNAQKATWIWYPGDFEVWLGNQMQNRRTERGTFFPPFWKLDNHYVLIDFHKDFVVPEAEEAEIYVEGQYNLKLDGKAFPGYPRKITIPAGKHRLGLKVFCQDRVPAIYIKGKTVVSDSTWQVTYEDKEWIDETGKTSDISSTTYLQAGSGNFNDPALPPSKYRLNTEPRFAVKTERKPGSLFVDFGRETFGYIKLHGLKGKGAVNIYFGESPEEALSLTGGELMDRVPVDQPQASDYVFNGSRAFRYVNIMPESGVRFDSASMLYEYAPVVNRGRFRCSDEQINKIWEVARYTMELNTREFFIDGIKRDRWIWSGDAYQSYLMNYYLFFDSPTVTRTLLALRGKDPVTSHINTIMDYTFYWFLGIYDYYQYTGDQSFIKQFYPRMQSLMDYCLGRRNKNGMMEGLPGDWVYIDWAEGLSKKGEVSFEQLLFTRSLETMALCAGIAGDAEGAARYKQLSADMKSKFLSAYWDANKGAIVHSRVNGVPTTNVTRYSNMFAVFFNYLDEAQKQSVKKNVLLNDSVQKITTPYMRFYELEALCALGEQKYVLKEMKDYWGGMLNLGATSFWEEYNPKKKGVEHYAMYGRPFGKSLCHAWGASPIYLMGKYYMGIKPLSPAYATYLVEPVLGGLQWMEGTVPTPNGSINLYTSTRQIKVKSNEGTGTLRFKSKSKPVSKGTTIASKGNGVYEMAIEKGKEYVVNYSAN